MATQVVAASRTTRPTWGALALHADALCCVAGGLLIAADSASLATFTGLPRPLLLALALPLIPYGAGLFVAARSPRLVPRLLVAVPAINALWVVASIGALVAFRDTLTTGGAWFVGIQALIVADFAAAQLVARRR